MIWRTFFIASQNGNDFRAVSRASFEHARATEMYDSFIQRIHGNTFKLT